MNHADHVTLLRGGIPSPGGSWADLGSGTGAFTLALAELVSPQGEIYSVDKDRNALREQELTVRRLFPDLKVHYLAADFSQPLDVPPLDGIVMANALHYQKHKEPLLHSIRNYLKPAGRFILVEYNVDRGNPWVPYPLSFQTWEVLAQRCGFSNTSLLATFPSRFLKEFYSAMSYRLD
jgi:ubiquinone/menaquinone biosynthesis C-methylase UbiE